MQFFIIAAAVILVIVIQLILQRRQAGKLTAELFPDTESAEPDEQFHIILRINNPSFVIYPFVRFGIIIPDNLTVHSDISTSPHPPSSLEVSATCMIWPRMTVERRITVSAAERGNYRFGNFYLEVGDFLGLGEYKCEYMQFNSVAVFPRPLANAKIEETLGSIIGDVSVRRYIFEDPVLISGFREYTGREPMKTISWPHSAKEGKLMVSKYDFTSEVSVSVLLDSDCRENLLEPCFSLARSVCDILERRSIEYDFFMNSCIGGANLRQHYFSKGMGARHHRGILMQLAMALDTCDFSGAELINRMKKSNRPSPGIIIVCAEQDPGRDRMISLIAENSMFSVSVIYAKDYIQGTTEREAVL